ncbi:MAG: hypothetical protein MJ057_07600 [Sphaerochaetaceae bacterium]|nr:hypothetical protein [Sphaerochaetaceae bacterium]
MNLKKIFIVSLLLVFAAVSVFANQATYRVTSDEVQTFRTLKRLSGSAMPEPTYPVTGDQLLVLVLSMDASQFDDYALALYENLVSALSEPQKDALFALDDDLSIDAALEVGSQVRFNRSSDELDFAQLYKRVSDAVNVDYFTANAWTKNAAARFEIGLTPGFSCESINKPVSLEIGLIEGAMPLTVWASVGGERLNFSIGRDRLSAGDGKTGNMALGDNFTFQNYAKVSYVSPHVTYDMTVRAFDPEKKALGADRSETFFHDYDQASPAVIDHRFSASFLDHFTASAFEGMLVYSNDALGDIRFYNPFMFLHNQFSFIGGTTNNYMGFEVGMTLPHGFEFNAQVNFDQLQLASEKDDEDNPPSTYGVLANVSWTSVVGKGILNLWLEGVMTTPYMNQRQIQDPDPEFGVAPEYFQTDLYVGNSRSDFSEMAPLGWYYGADSIAVAFGSSYSTSRADLAFDIMYRRHGYRNSWDEHKRYAGQSEWHNNATWVPETKAVEGILNLGMSLDYEIVSGFDLMFSAALVEAFNYQNIPGQRFESMQATVGAKITVNKANVLEAVKLFR